MWKWTTIFMLCCVMPIAFLFTCLVMFTPFSNKAEALNTPKGATKYVIGRVDYDGNFWWTHNSQKYEYALEDYGLSSANYKFMDEVKVYINYAQDIIKVTKYEHLDIRVIEILGGIIGSILVATLLMVCVYLPIAYRTFGKVWIKFYRNF